MYLIYFISSVVSNIIGLYLLIVLILYLGMSITGFIFYKYRFKYEKTDTFRKFAVLIPAHNEENVIRYILESIKKIKYPKDKYEVFVICDHCSDSTSDIAKNYDVNLIIYNDLKPSSKARALNMATDEILKNYSLKFDAFCYFDADSLIHPDFLYFMNIYLENGYKVIQGQQLPKNPYDSLVSLIISSGQLVTNRFFQKPKNILGLSATLHGKGICFDMDIVKNYRWDETCLTEDIEMQMRLIASGIRIFWGEEAIVYDEEPFSIMQYVSRSIRWTRGALDTAKKHLWKLFVRFLKYFDFKALEGFVYCAGVYRVVMIIIFSVILYFYRDSFNILIYVLSFLPVDGIIYKLLFIVMPFVFIPVSILIYDKIKLGMVFSYYLQPVLGIFRIPIFIMGLFRDREKWGRTEHLSKVSIEDIVY